MCLTPYVEPDTGISKAIRQIDIFFKLYKINKIFIVLFLEKDFDKFVIID